MTHYNHVTTFRAIPGGTGVASVAVETTRNVDDTEVNSDVNTDADGLVRISLADPDTSGQASYELHPGPYTTTGTASGSSITRKHSSSTVGSAGALDLSAQYQVNRAIGHGLLQSPAAGYNTGAVTADGADRTVDVATFAGVIQGLPVINDAIRAINISANASGNPRIDTVVIECTQAGQTEEGKFTLKVVEGTPAGSPVAPTLTQTSATWQFPLADVAVANGASTLSNANITDRRDYVERATTTVEADLVLLEARVDDLEDAAVSVPRVDLVAYYQAAWDPPSIAANSFVSVLATVTFVGGYTELLDSDVFVASHHEIDEDHRLTLVLCKSAASSDDVFLQVHNHTSSSLNPTSATLTILCYRLVLA